MHQCLATHPGCLLRLSKPLVAAAACQLGAWSALQSLLAGIPPNASNYSQQHADLEMILGAHIDNTWNELKHAWLGCLLDSNSIVLFEGAWQ